MSHSWRQTLARMVTDVLYDTDGRNGPGGLSRLLGLAAAGYAVAVNRRNRAFDSGRRSILRLTRPVISVGNITVGGTGKTPMAVYLAERLAAAGIRPAIVSRGYAGGWETRGGVVSDGNGWIADPTDSGDEPAMMARRLPTVPVIVGQDRVSGGRLAIDRFDPDVVLLDDGFQHRRLHRDLDILLLDARRPVGNGRLLPRGPLREPVHALGRAHAIVLTHADEPQTHPSADWTRWLQPSTPMFRAVHRPVLVGVNPAHTAALHPQAPDSPQGRCKPMAGANGFLVTGVADNRAVQLTLAALGGRIAGHRSFPDHHTFSRADMASVMAEARRSGADRLVTTEKDWPRLCRMPRRAMDLWVVGVRIAFPDNPDGFIDWLLGRIRS